MPEARNPNNPIQAQRSGAQCGVAEAVVRQRVGDTLLHGDFVACLRHAVPQTVRVPHTAACRPYVGLLRWPASSTLGGAVHSRRRLIRSINVGSAGHFSTKRNLRLARERTIAKIFQNSHRPTLRVDARGFAIFLQSAILFTKTTSFKSKNIIFIYLIFNKLNIIFGCFSRKDFVCLSAEILYRLG